MDRLQRSITSADGFEVLGDLRAAMAALDPPIPESLHGPAALVLTELVANSLIHDGLGDGNTVDVVIARLEEERLRIEVRDPGPCFDPSAYLRPPQPAEEGAGLFIVGTLADRWGVDRDENGRCVVWAEVAPLGA